MTYSDSGVANPIPSTLARVIAARISPVYLGRPSEVDVFVTDAVAIRGRTAREIAHLLGMPDPTTPFKIIEFESDSISGIASPVNRKHPGFVQGGRTRGGAPEFVIANQMIPKGAKTWIAY